MMDKINLTQPAAALFSERHSSLGASSDPDGFATALADVDQLDQKRPSIAQFMALTGASAKTATDIIYKYDDWRLYMNPTTAPEIEVAQQQIKSETTEGLRSTTQTARSDFAWLLPPEPVSAGAIVPRFHKETGQVTGIGFENADGSRFTGTSLLKSKDEVEQQALGYGVGTKGLNQFAQRLGAASFSDLNWNDIASHFPNKEAWTALYGDDSAL